MSEEQWHYMKDGKSVGPVSEIQLLQVLREGGATRETLAWRPGAERWSPLSEVLALEEAPPPLERKASSSGSGVFSDSQDTTLWSLAPARPWRRYFARSFDITLNGMITFLLAGLLLIGIFPEEDAWQEFLLWVQTDSGKLVFAMLISCLGMPLTALFIGLTGSSVGKWLFGVRVVDGTGRILGWNRAFKREFMVAMKGCAFFIPAINLITLLISYFHLRSKGKASWDEDLDCSVYYLRTGFFRKLLFVIFPFIFLIFAFLLGFFTFFVLQALLFLAGAR